MKNKLVHRSIIATFVSLYLLVSIISTIHVIEFFKLSNPTWLAISLAIAFELGAAASLASLVILDKMNKTLVWMLFGTITLMQMQGNMYYAFTHMENYQGWSELFGLIEEEVVYQKRVLSAVSGAILPLVALGFIKSLVDYIKPDPQAPAEEVKAEKIKEEKVQTEIKEEKFSYSQEELEEAKEWDETLEDGLEEEPVSEGLEERDEDHELDLVLNEMVEDIEVPSEEPANKPSDFIGGYYGDIPVDGDIVIDGGKGPSVQIEESQILPVNSNTPPPQKNTGIIDNAGSVHLNPIRL
jgi:uncharacterized membrane protein